MKNTAELIKRWADTRGGNIGVIVDQNSTANEIYDELNLIIKNRRIDRYTSQLKNEDSIDLHTDGITILNMESVKGQEFDAVFILEIENFFPCKNATMKRIMYMLCSRARDFLFMIYGPEPLSNEIILDLPSEQILERK